MPPKVARNVFGCRIFCRLLEQSATYDATQELIGKAGERNGKGAVLLDTNCFVKITFFSNGMIFYLLCKSSVFKLWTKICIPNAKRSRSHGIFRVFGSCKLGVGLARIHSRSFPCKITIQKKESFPAIKISGVKFPVCNPLVVATGTSGEQQRGYKSIDLYRLQSYLFFQSFFFHAAFSFHTVFKISQQYNTMLHTYILLGQFKKEFCLPTWNSVLIL